MAKIPPVRRISAEDFKEQAGWIEKLIQPINELMERTSAALNRSLTLTENMAGDLRTVELDGTWPVKLSWPPNLSRPAAVLVGGVYLGTTPVDPASAVQVGWSFNQAGQLQIDGVTGISPSLSNKYKVTLVIFTG